MTQPLSRILPHDHALGYERAVAATLRSLDLSVMYARSDELVASVRERLAVPMSYVTPEDDPQALAYGQVLPEDLEKDDRYLFFHADLEDVEATGPEGPHLVIAHLQYRKRPNHNPPQHMQDNSAAGRTVGWAEQVFASIATIGPPIVFVDAQLSLSSDERQERPLIPPIKVGGATLKRRGEEYVGAVVVGEVSRYRWLESANGSTRIWLAYSHKGLDASRGFWVHEGERCIEHLRTLGF